MAKLYSYNAAGVLLMDYFTAPKTEQAVMWWNNTDVTGLVLSLHQLVISVAPKGLSNKSDINVKVKLRVAASAPTNGTPLTPVNVDTSSTFAIPSTAFTNPEGLNCAFGGVYGGTLNCTEGANFFDFQGNSAISNFPGNSLVFTVESNDYCAVAIEQIFIFRQAAS